MNIAEEILDTLKQILQTLKEQQTAQGKPVALKVNTLVNGELVPMEVKEPDGWAALAKAYKAAK